MVTLAAIALSLSGVIHILLALLLLACVVWAAFKVFGLLPIPSPIKEILALILALLFLVWLAGILGFPLF